MFTYDTNGRLCCLKGFYPKLKGVLETMGYRVIYIDKDPPKRPEIYQADWDRVFQRFQFRPRQDDCLAQIDMHDYGVVVAPPAFGKTHLMAMIANLYPRAKIDIVTKRKDVVGRIIQLISETIPDVGQVGGGKHRDSRVTVYTADSLHRSNYTADILLADEGHELMTDRLAEMLGRYAYSRNYTFTATPDSRLDGAHARMEGVFGPQIFCMSQQEAERHELVVPVIVQWLDVRSDCDVAAPYKTIVARKRNGIWRNHQRNSIIAEAAKSFLQSGLQVLILVDTIDHALHLRRFLPEASLCYSEGALGQGTEKRNQYVRAGLLTDEEEMTAMARTDLRRRFERREVMCAIATGVWAVGVSFDSLNVLMRADAGDSETLNVQMPGRVCRIDSTTGKESGILVDFMDHWSDYFRARSVNRRRDYATRGWTQINADGTIWTPTARGHRGNL
jgi:superfamily II DNA or RNA helicase